MNTNVNFLSYPAQFFVEWEMLQTKIFEEIEAHILRSIIFFNENLTVYENVEKYFSAWQSTDDNRAHAFCVSGT